ncbi:DUF1801 domain-containing protein [Planococcus sp. YIM B11945]|uniref:DUF1801 domain-containing protein n=1 Tax=Planococcus sp. YIM B11945 TaxID=3435410 RepID=UPI003D7DB26E
MYEPKMKETDVDVIEFIENVEHPKKREEAFKLLQLFEETTGYPAKMWGPSIIGFGSYHYVYESGHSGDAPLVGFSPRKAKHSLYVTIGDAEREPLLAELGKHSSGKSCVYVNKLEDIDTDVLKKMIVQSMQFMKEMYPDQKQ